MDSKTAIFQSHERLISAIIDHGASAVWTDTIIPLIGASGEKADLLVGFSLDDPGKVAYAQSPAHKSDPAKRTKTKFGRFLTRRLKIEVTPEMHTEIGKIMGEDSYKDNDFDLRSDVSSAYRDLSSDAGSCMTNSPNDCLDFYADNQIPVLVWKGKARAMLFTIHPSGKRFVDRIYPADPDTIAAYERWASENGAVIRNHHGFDDDDKNGPMLPEKIWGSHVKVSAFEGAIPYVDTFAYLDPGEGRLYAERGSGRLELKNTDGENIHGDDGDSDSETCNQCNDRFDPECEGDFIDDNPYCESCAGEANYCERHGERTFDDGMVIDDEWHCELCASDANTCEHCEKSTFEETSEIEVESGTEEWCESCMNDNSYTCEKCDTVLSDEITAYSMLNGETICDPCYTEMRASWCPACSEHVPGGTPVYSAQHGENTCVDCAADNAFSAIRPVRALGGTALVLERV